MAGRDGQKGEQPDEPSPEKAGFSKNMPAADIPGHAIAGVHVHRIAVEHIRVIEAERNATEFD